MSINKSNTYKNAQHNQKRFSTKFSGKLTLFSFKMVGTAFSYTLNKFNLHHPTIRKDSTAQMDDGYSEQTKGQIRAFIPAHSSSSEAKIDPHQLIVGRAPALNLQPLTSNGPNTGFVGVPRSKPEGLYPWLVF